MFCKKCGTDMKESETCPKCNAVRENQESNTNNRRVSHVSYLLVAGAILVLAVSICFVFAGNQPQDISKREQGKEAVAEQPITSEKSEFQTEIANKSDEEVSQKRENEFGTDHENGEEVREDSNNETETVSETKKESESDNAVQSEEIAVSEPSLEESVMEAYRMHLDTLSSEYTYFTLRDVTGDGVSELIYYETDADGFLKVYTVMKYADGQLKDIMHGDTYGYQNMILGNENCLMLFLGGSDYDTTYFYVFTEDSVEKIETHAEYVYGMYDLEETFYINDVECTTEELRNEYMYYGIDYEDLNDANNKYPENRFIQSTEPLNFYVNSEQEKERVFGEGFSISFADEVHFNILLGILDYVRLYGGYFEEGVSVQDWNDEIKLSFLDCYIGTYCLDGKMVGMAIDEYSPVAAGLEADFHNNAYYAVKLSEVNRILEGMFSTGLKSTPSISCAIYHNGYYFFRMADFGNFMPTSVIESIEPKENDFGIFIIKVKCGQEIFGDDGQLYFEPNNGEGRIETFVVEKDVQALVSGMRILEWNSSDGNVVRTMEDK